MLHSRYSVRSISANLLPKTPGVQKTLMRSSFPQDDDAAMGRNGKYHLVQNPLNPRSVLLVSDPITSAKEVAIWSIQPDSEPQYAVGAVLRGGDWYPMAWLSVTKLLLVSLDRSAAKKLTLAQGAQVTAPQFTLAATLGVLRGEALATPANCRTMVAVGYQLSSVVLTPSRPDDAVCWYREPPCGDATFSALKEVNLNTLIPDDGKWHLERATACEIVDGFVHIYGTGTFNGAPVVFHLEPNVG